VDDAAAVGEGDGVADVAEVAQQAQAVGEVLGPLERRGEGAAWMSRMV
jgi:hypothetical protein